MYTYIYKYHYLATNYVFRQCQRGASCIARRELSNALVKSDLRLANVDIWPFSFRNAPAPDAASVLI